MPDLRVEWLKYRLVVPANVSYESPPAVRVAHQDFDGELMDGEFKCTMRSHYSAVDQARAVVEDYLRAWEVSAALKDGAPELRFEYADAHVIDRDPTPAGHARVIFAAGAEMAILTGTVTVHVTRRAYPSPPTGFSASPIVETLWTRYRRYRDGGEPLLSMAYYCLTVIEAHCGSRNAASDKLRIESAVLSKLGELTSVRGDHSSARKASRTGAIASLTPAESAWIDHTVRALIKRMGEHAAGVSVNELRMSDLPGL
jgi:hypothetical protein